MSVCTTSDEVYIPLQVADNTIVVYDNATFYKIFTMTDLGINVAFDNTIIDDAIFRVVKQDGTGDLFYLRHSDVVDASADGTLTFHKGEHVTTDPSTMTAEGTSETLTKGLYDVELLVEIASRTEMWWTGLLKIVAGHGGFPA